MSCFALFDDYFCFDTVRLKNLFNTDVKVNFQQKNSLRSIILLKNVDILEI